MDLFALANANGQRLAERFLAAKNAKVSVNERSALQSFADHVQERAQISINMRPWILRSFLATGNYWNIHRWAEEQAALSGRPTEDILKERLGKYFVRRIAFDQSFEKSSDLLYGALNIGGAAATKFGVFCVVLAASFAEAKRSLAYLMRDSLAAYVDDSGKVDVDAIGRDCASHDSRHHLTAIKLAATVPNVSQACWPELVCSDSDYVEAIFALEIGPKNVDEVRIPECIYQELRSLAFDDFTRKLSDGEKALVQDFVEILRAERNNTVKLRRV